MTQSATVEEIYQELRRRAVAEFGEERAAELEDFLQTTAYQIGAVEQVEIDADLEPLLQG